MNLFIRLSLIYFVLLFLLFIGFLFYFLIFYCNQEYSICNPMNNGTRLVNKTCKNGFQTTLLNLDITCPKENLNCSYIKNQCIPNENKRSYTLRCPSKDDVEYQIPDISC